MPQYESAVEQAGGDPVRIVLGVPELEIRKLARDCDGVLLPGSRADVDPEKYAGLRHPNTAPADLLREQADRLLLANAFAAGKPILGICYGLQSLNVYCRGTLTQHIESEINHAPGPIRDAHKIEVELGTRLASIVGDSEVISVNSSHHQAAERIGEGLKVAARCAEDGVIEALEGTDGQHFVVAVQWHPERSVDDAPSRAIFEALVEAARGKRQFTP